MITYPPAKINLGLNVTGNRNDGFHTIKSFFYAIPITDILEINKAEEFGFNTSGLAIPGGVENNLIVKAYNLLKRDFNIGDCQIHLHKMIPMGAGLGGGSANGTYTLRMLNELFELNLSIEQRLAYAERLGSDCPFFVHDEPCFTQGRGEILEPIDLSLEGYWIKLINPGIHISTKTAFERIKPSDSNLIKDDLSTANITQWKNFLKNDFENTVFETHPEIKTIKDKLYQENAIYASMTGTGSSVYGIFSEKPESTFANYFEFISKL